MNSMIGSKGFKDRIMEGTGPTSAGGKNNSTGFYKEKIPKGYKMGQIQNFDPSQMDLYQSLFPYLGEDSDLARMAQGDQSFYEQMEVPAYREFNEQIGGLASRFSQPGTGARRSSGFQNTSTQAASNFAQDLQAKRQEYQRQARRDLFEMSHSLLGERPMDRFLYEKPQKEGFNWQGLAGAGVGAVGGFFAGGPAGAFGGAKTGYDIGSSFGGHK